VRSGRMSSFSLVAWYKTPIARPRAISSCMGAGSGFM
jgi:hypothetical protein